MADFNQVLAILKEEEEAKEIQVPDTLGAISRLIRKDWGSKVNFSAKPYLSAMSSLDSINDENGADSGRSIVAYFLSNASSWKGPVAKKVKKVLNDMVKKSK